MGATLGDVIQATEMLVQSYPDQDGRLQTVASLALLTGEVAKSSDRGLMAATRSQLGRFRRRLVAGRRGEDMQTTLKVLRDLEQRLSAAIREEDVRLEDGRRGAEITDLRSRIVAELEANGVVRPREIATRLNVDPSQVSRAMRSLVEDGTVEPAPTVGGVQDRRAHFYRLAGVPAAI
ncbi:MAG TPA: winged helix-turn-helix domain-containing protein [Candidatus Dormibacteraeota bacterium]|jgi:ribosomal protein S25|nr:winged helix-turn-helix domain-containing protein [Candidatus Dormibacteraeota bacterium]